MLKHPSLQDNKEFYLELFRSFDDNIVGSDFEFANHSTINQFIKKVEWYSRKHKDNNEKHNFRGLTFEIFAEIFFKFFQNHPVFGITNYNLIPVDSDHGVDATGINPDGSVCAIQIKFRVDAHSAIIYSDLAKMYMSGVEQHGIDPKKKNVFVVLTTSKKVTPNAMKIFGDRLLPITRNTISHLIDNNIDFWEFARNEIEVSLLPQTPSLLSA